LRPVAQKVAKRVWTKVTDKVRSRS
jgi:hypothetical protein